MKEAHGKVYKSKGTKVLVLYHPSRIEQFMDRNLYKSQLRTLFSKLITGSEIDLKFDLSQNVNDQYTTKTNTNQEKTIYTNYSFVLPSTGNLITERDIKEGYLRITTDYKKYFPDDSCDVVVNIMTKMYSVAFKHRDHRSHLHKMVKKI